MFGIPFIFFFFLTFFITALSYCSGEESHSQAGYCRVPGVTVHVDVKIPMRDGVNTSADIYFPPGAGPFPVVLTRTPYDNTPLWQQGLFYAQHGYVFVAQDCRGRYDSEGTFYPWHQEVADGLDTRRWIAKQSWSNGKLGTVGGSYLGMDQWLGTIESTEHLTCMVPAVTPIDGWIWGNEYENGAYQLALNQVWGLTTTNRTLQPTDQYDWRKLLMFLPLNEMDKVATGKPNPFIQDWINHPTYDDYWRKISIEDKFSQIDVPVYILEGWFDSYAAAAFRGFTGIRKNSKSERARNSTKILVGPWPHGINRSSHLGELDFGPQAVIDKTLPELSLQWLDHWLKGVDNEIMNEPPIKIFVMGANVWRNEHEWPLARTKFTKYYFLSSGKANSIDGDGSLSTIPPDAHQAQDKYFYNPDNPVWERGGNLSYSLPGIGDSSELAGPFDQRPTERRDDVLVYTSAELNQDVEVTGPVTVQLYISSSAPDTDFAVRLVDVCPDGRAMGFSEGIMRARYRDSRESPQLMQPGTIYLLTIEMQPTSLVFLKGHRIRVHVTSSDFPHFDRNPNTGGEFGKGSEVKIAEQQVYHDRKHPSCIVLPIIPVRSQ
jgi:hypothetical protein